MPFDDCNLVVVLSIHCFYSATETSSNLYFLKARCDELARKAAELQCENDNLKKVYSIFCQGLIF